MKWLTASALHEGDGAMDQCLRHTSYMSACCPQTGEIALRGQQRGIVSPPCAANRPQVQDTLDPEYYLGAARLLDGSWATTKFSDAALTASPPAEEDMKVNLMNIQG